MGTAKIKFSSASGLPGLRQAAHFCASRQRATAVNATNLPKLLSWQGPACLILPRPGTSFNYGQKCCQKSPSEINSPFPLAGAHAKGFMETILSQLNSCTCACVFPPSSPALSGSDRFLTITGCYFPSSQTNAIWKIFFFWWGSLQFYLGDPKAKPGETAAVAPAAPGV